MRTCYLFTTNIQQTTIKMCCEGIKWHPWRGSYRFLLLQELFEDDDLVYYDEEERDKNVRTLKRVLKTTRLDQCETHHLFALRDVLEGIDETGLFPVSFIVKMAFTIDNRHPNKTICWQVIGKMMEKIDRNPRMKQLPVLRLFLTRHQKMLEDNLGDGPSLDVISELFYEVVRTCEEQRGPTVPPYPHPY